MKRVLFLILTVAAIVATAGLSVGASGSEAANAAGENVVKLPVAEQVDLTARTEYQEKQVAKRAAEEIARLAAEQAARPASTVAVAKSPKIVTKPAPKPAPTPVCDRLIIPKINFNSCLATVGLTSGGAVGVHATLPAWFNQSSRAGTSSGQYKATFIDGHRSGIFRNLGALAVGDTVTVAFASGESYTYTVRATERTPLSQVDMGKALSIWGGAGQGLNLMTCDGAYSSNLGTAEARLTIYTTR